MMATLAISRRHGGTRSLPLANSLIRGSLPLREIFGGIYSKIPEWRGFTIRVRGSLLDSLTNKRRIQRTLPFFAQFGG